MGEFFSPHVGSESLGLPGIGDHELIRQDAAFGEGQITHQSSVYDLNHDGYSDYMRLYNTGDTSVTVGVTYGSEQGLDTSTEGILVPVFNRPDVTDIDLLDLGHGQTGLLVSGDGDISMYKVSADGTADMVPMDVDSSEVNYTNITNVGDLNGDGIDDFIAQDEAWNSKSFVSNSSEELTYEVHDITFGNQDYRNNNSSENYVAVDENNDGITDVVFTTDAILEDKVKATNIDMFENDGNGNLSYKDRVTTYGKVVAIEAGDYDDDGDVDIALGMEKAPDLFNPDVVEAKVLLNNGDFSFDNDQAIILPSADLVEGDKYAEVKSLDIDHDGIQEVAVLTHTKPSTVGESVDASFDIYEMNNGEFVKIHNTIEIDGTYDTNGGRYFKKLEVGDFEGNSEQDLAFVGNYNEPYIFNNNGDHPLTPQAFLPIITNQAPASGGGSKALTQ